MGKGGGGSGPTTSTVHQSSLPEYAQPFYESLMARTQDISNAPYQPYQGARIAGFNPYQEAAMSGIGSMQNPQEMDAAAMGAYGAMQRFGGFNGAPQQVSAPQGYSSGISMLRDPREVNAQQYSPFSTINAQQVGFERANAPSVDPTGRYINRNEIERVDPNAINAGMRGPRDTGVGAFSGTVAQQYMSPYMQNVVDIQKREATRDANVATQARNSGLVSKGAFGGTRQAVIQAEADKNLQQQLGDIQQRGQQSSFENAQQQFERDRSADFMSQAANQGNTRAYDLAGQNVGLQAGLANQGAGLQALLANQGVGARGDLANQQYGWLSNSANQQAGITTGIANQGANLNAQNMNNQWWNSAQQANQGADLQAQLANQNAFMNNNQFGANMLQNWNQQLGNWDMQAALANQNAGLAGNAQNLQAYAGMGNAANTLANIGGNQQSMFLDRMNAMYGAGQNQQDMMQRMLDLQYNEFTNARDYPRQNLSFMSGIMHGVPTSPSGEVTQYQPAPNFGGTMAGLGALGLGAANYQGG